MKDKFLLEDLEIVVNSNLPLENLDNSSVFITGATGLVGVNLIRALIAINNKGKRNIRIIALIRNMEKVKQIFGDDLEKIEVLNSDIREPINYEGKVDYIIHCAGITTSKVMINQPVETLITAVDGTKNILDFAKEKKIKSMIYVSSMEVYGSLSGEKNEVKENDIGFVDPLIIRSNYPESKRLCENMCVAYLAEYGVPVKIARLAQTFGAGILEGENRVFAQFARSVISNEDIILHTEGKSEGNYCYLRDTVRALLILLIKGENGEAYNISNPETHTTIADMAKMVCEKIANNKIKVVFDIQEQNNYGYASVTKMKLNSDKMQNLGWKPEVGLEESYIRLIGSMMCK